MLDYAALLIAFLISAVSAFYSISGLTAIFAGAVIPIMVMGGALEIGKVVTTVWLRRNWNQTGIFLKAYLSVSITVLMLITSMGIFGFLSRAHLEQGTPTGDIQAQIQLIDDRIQAEKENINANRTVLTQMDGGVNEILSRSNDERGAARAVQLRRSQAAERSKLQKENESAQKRIQQLQTEKAPLQSQIRKIEVEVGPIKYIAAIIYGENTSTDILEKAVRWVIIVLVAVFDPLALALMLAVNRKRELDQLQRNAQLAITEIDRMMDTAPSAELTLPIKEPVVETPPAPLPVPEPPAVIQTLPAEQATPVTEIVTPTQPFDGNVIVPPSKKKKPQVIKNQKLNTSPDPNELLKLKKSSKSPSKSSSTSPDPNELLKLKDQLKSKKLLKKLWTDPLKSSSTLPDPSE